MLGKSPLFLPVKTAMLAAAALAISVTFQIVFTGPADAHSRRFCEDYAHGYADRRTGNAFASTVRGAGTGAIFGGIIDGRQGARRGAAVGAGVGLVRSSAQGRRYYRYFDRAFDRCMRM